MTLQGTPAIRPHSLRERGDEIADALAPKATREDVRYQIELRALIERGRIDIRTGRAVSIAELMAVFEVSG